MNAECRDEAGLGAVRGRDDRWCGYVLLALATVLALLTGPKNLAWQATTLAIVAAAAGWIYLMFTRARRRSRRIGCGWACSSPGSSSSPRS